MCSRHQDRSAGTGSDSEKDTFKVQSVLPDDQTVSVPVNTGIEITFSDRVSDIDSLVFRESGCEGAL